MSLRELIRAALASGLSWLLMAAPMAIGAGDRNVLVLGDSISAAYGMTLEEGWVAGLEERFRQRGLNYRAVNASISGDTTDGGLRRLPALLEQHQPAVVIVELGGNDGLRGYPVTRMRDNLTAIVARSQAAGAEVVVLGMEIPPNFGERYTQLFRNTFRDVAAATKAHYGGFLLENVALEEGLMQADGIHPTASAQPALLDHVWQHLEPLL